MKKVIIKITPTIFKDEYGNYTIFDGNSKGGAIVSDLNPFVAMEKFKEATILAFAVRNLLAMGKSMNWHIPEFILKKSKINLLL